MNISHKPEQTIRKRGAFCHLSLPRRRVRETSSRLGIPTGHPNHSAQVAPATAEHAKLQTTTSKMAWVGDSARTCPRRRLCTYWSLTPYKPLHSSKPTLNGPEKVLETTKGGRSKHIEDRRASNCPKPSFMVGWYPRDTHLQRAPLQDSAEEKVSREGHSNHRKPSGKPGKLESFCEKRCKSGRAGSPSGWGNDNFGLAGLLQPFSELCGHLWFGKTHQVQDCGCQPDKLVGAKHILWVFFLLPIRPRIRHLFSVSSFGVQFWPELWKQRDEHAWILPTVYGHQYPLADGLINKGGL